MVYSRTVVDRTRMRLNNKMVPKVEEIIYFDSEFESDGSYEQHKAGKQLVHLKEKSAHFKQKV